MTSAPTIDLEPAVRRALGHGHTIDMTTIGAKTGLPRRLEIVFHNFGGRLLITGMPRANRTRSWLYNLRANPKLTIHLKQLVQADLPATAREITNGAERREVLVKVARLWKQDVDTMVMHSPLIEVTIEGYGPTDPA